ncbi:MAG: PilZ domain-containing protein [Allosphingosinicella sp.]|uniref:PilZ domain-containing protein n=1 Tax=Allosphingosinicella sp. TaxID=2823234 RepID=UPI003948FCCE
MHDLRAAILSGDGVKPYSPVTTKETCRRKSGAEGSLVRVAIPRAERRITNQRREDRHRGIVERAMIGFRRKKLLVKVVNISASGLMIEADIEPRIGERISVTFEGMPRIDGIVRWVREGRIGLDVGDQAIALE